MRGYYSKMASGSSDDYLQGLKTRLLERIVDLGKEIRSVRDKIDDEQDFCTEIILKQTQVNEELFTTYHDMIWEKMNTWPDEFQHIFNNIDNNMNILQNWLGEFESKSSSAMASIITIRQTLKAKEEDMNELIKNIENSSDDHFLESVDLDDFHWVEPDLWPDTDHLEDEWRNKNLYQIVRNYLVEMEQLFRSPLDLLDHMSLASHSSSSDSAENIL